MKKMGIMLSVLLIVLLAGCEAMFEFNAFESFDKKEVKIDTTSTTTQEISEMAESPSFFEKLAEDPAQKEAVVVVLTAKLDDPAAPPIEKQVAALVLADVQIQTNPDAVETVNAILDVVLDPPDTTGSDSISSFVGTMLPLSVDPAVNPEGAKTEFTTLFTSLVSAGQAYKVFGNSLTDTNSDGVMEAESGPVSGSVAQTAAITIMLATVVDAIQIVDNPEPTTEEKIGALFEYIYNGDTNISLNLDTTSGSNPVDVISDAAPSIMGIASAAGLDLQSLFQSSGSTM